MSHSDFEPYCSEHRTEKSLIPSVIHLIMLLPCKCHIYPVRGERGVRGRARRKGPCIRYFLSFELVLIFFLQLTSQHHVHKCRTTARDHANTATTQRWGIYSLIVSRDLDVCFTYLLHYCRYRKLAQMEYFRTFCRNPQAAFRSQ